MTAKEWTIHGLSVELRMDRRTVADLVKDIDPVTTDGRSKKYLMRDVFTELLLTRIKKG